MNARQLEIRVGAAACGLVALCAIGMAMLGGPEEIPPVALQVDFPAAAGTPGWKFSSCSKPGSSSSLSDSSGDRGDSSGGRRAATEYCANADAVTNGGGSLGGGDGGVT